MKDAMEDAVRFYDVKGKVGVNVVPLSRLAFCPREGEVVYLPGVNGVGAAEYVVEGVYHTFAEDTHRDIPNLARVFSVRVDVRRRRVRKG
jgi:hypothetical protein